MSHAILCPSLPCMKPMVVLRRERSCLRITFLSSSGWSSLPALWPRASCLEDIAEKSNVVGLFSINSFRCGRISSVFLASYLIIRSLKSTSREFDDIMSVCIPAASLALGWVIWFEVIVCRMSLAANADALCKLRSGSGENVMAPSSVA